MEVEETTEIKAEEVDMPAESEVVEQIADGEGADDTKEPDDAPERSGFSAKFGAARERAAERQTGEEVEDEAAESDSDEKMPEAEETEEAQTEDPAEELKDETTEVKKTARSESFKKMEADRDAALAENTEIKTRLSELDARFEKHGGMEAVETAMELFDLAADKSRSTEFVEKINSLPHKALIQREIFENVLDLPANRVYGINRVLREDFGLEENLNQPVLEKLFEFVTVRLNRDPAEFENFLERELELSNNPESENERLRAEIERLKTQPKEEKTSQPETETEFATRIQQTYNKFEDEAFEQVSQAELQKYGFAVTSSDPPELKRAKERMAQAAKFAVAVEMREAKAHQNLLDFWIEKTPEDNKFYSQAAKTYRSAMTLKVQNFLKDVAPILGAIKAGKAKKTEETAVQTAAKGEGQTNIQPPKRTDKKPLGFSGAFAEARKAVPSQ